MILHNFKKSNLTEKVRQFQKRNNGTQAVGFQFAVTQLQSLENYTIPIIAVNMFTYEQTHLEHQRIKSVWYPNFFYIKKKGLQKESKADLL